MSDQIYGTITRAYVIIDGMLGFLLIPTISAVLALRLAAVDFKKAREKRHRNTGYSRDASHQHFSTDRLVVQHHETRNTSIRNDGRQRDVACLLQLASVPDCHISPAYRST